MRQPVPETLTHSYKIYGVVVCRDLTTVECTEINIFVFPTEEKSRSVCSRVVSHSVVCEGADEAIALPHFIWQSSSTAKQYFPTGRLPRSAKILLENLSHFCCSICG
ncbi:unnamed protein product [Allacma fusca]|uniref:Uncharacterized protein n=1 Tax=Allacma fusca TaxID=39272 RepID=A0A8J2JUG5_9HEXA|nr:unnamed protein product [Allacma fusca]